MMTAMTLMMTMMTVVQVMCSLSLESVEITPASQPPQPVKEASCVASTGSVRWLPAIKVFSTDCLVGWQVFEFEILSVSPACPGPSRRVILRLATYIARFSVAFLSWSTPQTGLDAAGAVGCVPLWVVYPRTAYLLPSAQSVLGVIYSMVLLAFNPRCLGITSENQTILPRFSPSFLSLYPFLSLSLSLACVYVSTLVSGWRTLNS
mmetsp:Transcript_79922/g.175314  ORF Transcript_79922/g.175314 Transcript_79922/m.175314 type:complete len:206 (+) Transcript_79922:419-1036(+)